MKKLNYAGDTIIEVIISMSILAFALGTAYATVNRSNLSIMANKERFQAQLIASRQIEYLRQYRLQNGSYANLNTDNTCLKLSGASVVATYNTLPSPASSCDFSEVYGATYVVNTKYVSCPDPPTSTSYCTYKITVNWDSIKGGRETLALWYGL